MKYLTSLGLAWLVFVTAPQVSAIGFSEPPVIIQGKVIQRSEGSAMQLYAGTLVMTLVAEDNPDHTVIQTVKLDQIGDSGEVSYRIEIAQRYLPESQDLESNLATGVEETNYRFDSITIDGESAVPLDPTQSLITTSFSTRGTQLTLDLLVSLEQVDSDGDGIPDWWEELHGLNPSLASDAESDNDFDGILALAEFQGGSDPNFSNTRPLLQATSLLVPLGGQAGLHLKIIDANSAPEDITIALDAALPGLSVWNASGEIATSVQFTYAEILAGNVWLVADTTFGGGIIPITLNDDFLPADPVAASLRVEVYSPAAAAPALWLDVAHLGGSLSADDPIADWTDATGNLRDGYQPYADQTPTYQSDGVTFDGSSFLYLDDRGLDLSEFTALVRFDIDSFQADDQTVFSIGGLKLEIGGRDNPDYADSHHATHDGHEILGSSLASNDPGQITLTRFDGNFSLGFHAGHFFPSQNTASSEVTGFSTIGGSQAFTDATASALLYGGVQEIIIFEESLTYGALTRAEDYQRSRWDGMLVWDYRDDAIALTITGTEGRRNLITSGWGQDVLIGQDLDDTLRGGPSDDRMTGGGGADRFHIFGDHGHDTITDFSEDEGDVLDLTGIFGGLSGTPESYLNFRTEVVRGDDDIPQVHSFLELDHDGDGSDQTITFENHNFVNADLPRLVGEGTILLGGPGYEVGIEIAGDSSTMEEIDDARSFVLTRSGNTEAALEVALSFTGSADVDDDYTLDDASGSGAVRTVSFARGASTASFTLSPIIDDLDESEQVTIQVMARALITTLPDEAITFDLEDSQVLSLFAVRHVFLDTPTSGQAILSRAGDISEPLDVPLTFSGTAVNGIDYQSISATANFAAGESQITLEIDPIGSLLTDPAPGTGASIPVAWINIVPDPDTYRVSAPGYGEIQFLQSDATSALGFKDWRDLYFLGDTRTDAQLAAADDDLDTIPNAFEYVRGQIPTTADPDREPLLNIQMLSDGHFTLETVSIEGMSDFQFSLEQTSDMEEWSPADNMFSRELLLRSDGRIDRVYRSLTPGNDTYLYRLSLELTDTP